MENNGGYGTAFMYYPTYTEIWGDLGGITFFNLEIIDRTLTNLDKMEDSEPDLRLWNIHKLIAIGLEGASEISIGIGKNNFDHIYISCLLEDEDHEVYHIADSFEEFINGFESKYTYEELLGKNTNKFEEACIEGDFEKARKLIHSGYEYHDLHNKGKSIIDVAIDYKMFDILLYIAKKRDLKAPLFICRNNIEAADFMLENGCNVNAKNDFGQTALFNSCSNFEFTKHLIEKGIDVKIKDNSGKKAIDYINPDLYIKPEEKEEKIKIYNLLKQAEERLY